MYYYVAHEPSHWRQTWIAKARRRYKRSSHSGSTTRADSRLSPCMYTRARTHVRSASRVQTSLFFFSSLRSVGRRSGRSPLWARYTSHDVVRRVGRCRKRVRFNAVLLPPAYNTRSPPIALLSFCSLRASLRARYTYRADPLLWQPLNWLFGPMHLSLIPEANPWTTKALSMLRDWMMGTVFDDVKGRRHTNLLCLKIPQLKYIFI